jgi:YesN/AraC family two-component response regulator
MLICDDERWIREGIRSSIDWSSLGIDTVLTARDGKQAIEIVKAEKPDVVITDIKMPNTNGLEMIDAIKETIDPNRIIVISGFSSFQFAQTALKFGVSDYILKPIDEDALIAAVQKCLTQKNDDELIDDKIILAAIDRLHLWLNRINTAVPDASVFLDVFNIDIKDFPFVQTVVCQQKFSVNKESEKSFLVHNGSAQEPYIVFQSCADQRVGLFFSKHDDAKDPSLQNIFFTEGKITAQDFCIGVGSVLLFADAWQSYQQAEDSLMYRLFFPQQEIFFYTEMLNRKEKSIDNFDGFNLSKPVTLLVNRHFARYKNWVNTIFEMTKANLNSINPKEWKSFFAALVSQVGQVWKLDTNAINEMQNKISAIWNLDILCKELLMLPEKISLHEDPGIKKNFSFALEYIEKNYSEQISMSQAAEAIGLNPSYFSKMFSECAGISFLKFLTRYRMEKAIVMMKEGSEKIYEIAEKVGYTDYRVFSRNFREYCGVSPTDYRNRIV